MFVCCFYLNLICWSFCKHYRMHLLSQPPRPLAKGFSFSTNKILIATIHSQLYKPVANRTEHSLIKKERQERLTDSLVLNPSRERKRPEQLRNPNLFWMSNHFFLFFFTLSLPTFSWCFFPSRLRPLICHACCNMQSMNGEKVCPH